MKKENTATNMVLGLIFIIVLGLLAGMVLAPKAQAVPDSVAQFPYWSWSGHVTTTMDELVAAPGDNKVLVLDVVNSCVSTGGAGDGFEIVADSTVATEYFHIQATAASPPANNIFQRFRMRENEGIDILALGSGSDIFLVLEGHIEYAY